MIGRITTLVKGSTQALPSLNILPLLLLTLAVGCTDVTLSSLPVDIEVNPPSLTFETTRVDQQSGQSFSIFETGGDSPAVVRSLALSGPGAMHFSLPLSGEFTIAAGGEASVQVLFQPQAVGEFDAELTLVVNDDHGVIEPITLHGVAKERDGDGDGYGEGEGDCNDADASQNPSGKEVCNELDDDCDGVVDEQPSDPLTYYEDHDGDGYGVDPVLACKAAPGTAELPGDCDDSNSEIHPNAEELCDGIDQNCQGDGDFGASDTSPWYLDGDGDGFGSPDHSMDACLAEEGYISTAGDCDDENDAIFPGADELCDELDNDCDEIADEEAIDQKEWFIDADGDTYGDPSSLTVACDGIGPNQGRDCDDGNELIHPDAAEHCNLVDEDCDGAVDEGALDGVVYYIDGDSDGYGLDSSAQTYCSPPLGASLQGGDCDDTLMDVNPEGSEHCNGLDDDCNGLVDDDAIGAEQWFLDADQDGFGNDDEVIIACVAPEQHVGTGMDCNDGNASIYPAANEYCNTLDDDCDSQVDEEAIDAQELYTDRDRDGFGDSGTLHSSCDPSEPSVAGDCDDDDSSIYPEAAERCDLKDQDCDGLVDETPVDGYTFFLDGDSDGFGSEPTLSPTCDAPDGAVVQNNDCDDDNDAIHPDAAEVCNELDDDCDGLVDVQAVDVATYFADGDSDGFGDSSVSQQSCTGPEGYVSNSNDCDDVRSEVHPGADESCNGTDDDCDFQVDEDAVDQNEYYVDLDGDGFGTGDSAYLSCDSEGISLSGDCEDTNADIFPGADELCDNVDQDCDAAIDEQAINQQSFALDGDGDGYGHPESSILGCQMPDNASAERGDCDDADDSIHPEADELCNALDDNCNGLVDEDATDAEVYYLDEDQDGYGSESTLSACEAPQTHSSQSGDCNDSDDGIHPGAEEFCDEQDQDCDNLVDENAVDALVWAPDGDGDGHGDGEQTVSACEAPDGTVEVPPDVGADCDDDDPDTHPGATEDCDGMDHNCDGSWSPATCEGCHVDAADPNALYQSIQTALEDAAHGLDFGGRIGICAGTYEEVINFAGAPVILQAVGEGDVVISAAGCLSEELNCSVVTFNQGEGAASGISGIRLQGGIGARRKIVSGQSGDTRVGGAILIDGAGPTLIDLILEDNSAGDGSAIAMYNGDVELVDPLISDLNAERGAALFVHGGSLNLQGGSFTGMHSNHEGSALFIEEGAIVNIEDAFFGLNVGAGYGGAVYAQDSELSIVDSEFTGNASHSSSGGALYLDGGSLELSGVDFVDNSVAGGGDQNGGGALHLHDTDFALISDGLFSGNSSNGYGGAVSVIGASDVSLERCQFIGNDGATHGGAIHAQDAVDLWIDDALMLNNAARYGGALYVGDSSIQLLRSYLEGNIADEFGGALYLRDGDILVSNNAILANSSGRFGGGVALSFFEGEFLNNDLVANHSSDKGSGIYSESIRVAAKVQNNIINMGSHIGVFAGSQMATAYQYNNSYGNNGGNTSGFTMAGSNLTTDPRYMGAEQGDEPETWDLSLNVWSPCLDAGNPALSSLDLDGSPNDMGQFGGPLASP